MVDQATLKKLLPEVLKIAQSAGKALLPYYKKIKPHQITEKQDQSPVTEADHAAHMIIDTGLSALTPDWPVLSEEGEYPRYSVRKNWQQYWLVDPLDGTRGFIRHSEDFTVNIALIDQGKPVLGVLVKPVTQDSYYAITENGQAYHQHADEAPVLLQPVESDADVVRVVCGHFDRSIKIIKSILIEPKIKLIKMNSSIKFAALAMGAGDIYCRFGDTSEWDTAAGQSILEAAGGAVVDFEGNTLQYNAKSSLINPSFLAVRDKAQLETYLNMVNELRRKS